MTVLLWVCENTEVSARLSNIHNGGLLTAAAVSTGAADAAAAPASEPLTGPVLADAVATPVTDAAAVATPLKECRAW